MCGRFAFYTPKEAITNLFDVDFEGELAQRYNIAPTQHVPVIRSAPDQGRELTMMRWGLVPFWAKDPAIGNRMINARSETAAQKPAFRAAFKKRRCLVPATGFYEWKKVGDKKVPYFISLKSGDPFAMAGLWEHWTDENDELLETFTILTTEPNDFMADLHNRMPAIIERDRYAAWLDTGVTGRETLEAILAPHDGEPLHAYPVSRVVNNPRNEGAELVEPAAE